MKLSHRDRIDDRNYPQLITQLRWNLIPALDRHDWKHHPRLLDPVDRQTYLLKKVYTSAFEIPYIIGMMDDSHLVSLVISDIYNEFRTHIQ